MQSDFDEVEGKKGSNLQLSNFFNYNDPFFKRKNVGCCYYLDML